jgi:condensin complex subunit 2
VFVENRGVTAELESARIMLKRDHFEGLSTPKAESKRPRESSGSLQDLKTPLKNAPSSASFDFISPRRPGDEEEERKRNRAGLVKKQQESREALRSPAANASPRAESPSSITGNLKRSATGSGSGLINDFTSNSGSSPNSLTAHGTRSILTASKSKLSLSSSKLNSSQPPLALTVEQMTKSFDEWMKMAADNKINSKNSWNFALIDYFSELTFLRDGDSINFQKASCTLDGCVKIYASRVDSVVDETTKLLNGLSDKTNKFKFEEQEDEEEADAEAENNGNINNSGSSKQKSKLKKSSLRTIETIEKNPENLILKNFDLEFSIDPLFKKTSAEFDESGTKGALLKNLECSPVDNLIIFDSSDQISIDFTDKINSSNFEEDEKIEISYLSSIFGSSIIDLSSKTLCPTFDQYNFNNSLSDIKGTLEKLSRISPNIPQAIQEADQLEPERYPKNEEEEEDLIVVIENDDREVDDLQFDDYMANDDGGFNDFDDQSENAENVETDEKAVKWSNTEEVTDETGLSYFDGAFKQTWAGPEHWKIRKSQRIVNNNTNNNNNNNSNYSNSNNNTISNTKSRSRKNSKVEKVAIDFVNSVIDFRQIFSKPTTSGQISLTKAAILERNEHDHLLPDDFHFSSSSLLKLFIKPNWKMKSATASQQSQSQSQSQSARVTRSSSKASSEPSGNFVERDFWVSQDDHRNGLFQGPEHFEYDEYANDGINDNIYDGYTDNEDNFFSNYGEEPFKQDPSVTEPGNNNNNEPAEPNENNFQVDFNKNLVAAPKFTNAQQLNYARVAKRVDVAKLKSTLWNEFVQQPKQPKQTTTTHQQDKQAENQEKSSKTFSSLIKNLSKSYPSEALADLSVPYCFICLLHLANENNLEIQQSTENEDLIIRN